MSRPIHKIIKSRRKELGLTLEQLGEKIGVSKERVFALEKESPKNTSKDILDRLADALGLENHYLIEKHENNQ